jgi:hypothetical protein
LRAEQFLETDDLRTLARSLANAPLGFGEILARIARAGHLYQSHAKFRITHKYHCMIRTAQRL